MSIEPSPLLLRFDRQKIYFPIPVGHTIIGRLPRCGLVLGEDGKRVSRDHAELRRSGNQLFVRDLDSRNGTLVNGEDIRGQGSVEIQLGDRLKICDYEAIVTNRRTPFNDSGVCNVDFEVSPLDTGQSHATGNPLGTVSDNSMSSVMQTRLSALVSIGKSLGDALHTEQMLEKAVESILEIFPAAERSVVGFADDDMQFVPKWWTLRNGNRDSEIRVSQRIFQHVLSTADSVLFSDATSHFHSSGSVMAGLLRSVMCSPLVDSNGKVVGMIQADSRTVDKFDASDLEIFATVATQISLALNFSRLHQEAINDAMIRKDIHQATIVQQQFLPSEPPTIPGYEFAHYYAPARHVGGDYYDYVPLADGRLAVVLGDVVGKGVPAALTMVKLATETRTAFEITCDPAAAMTRLNQRLTDFITCVMLVIDPVNHSLQVVTAGHETPLLKTTSRPVQRIDSEAGGLPLSVFAESEYRADVIQLAPGDCVLVYSDGFADAEQSHDGPRFGKDRIIDLLEHHQGRADKLVRNLVERVDNFTGGYSQFDDMCMVCFRRQLGHETIEL